MKHDDTWNPSANGKLLSVIEGNTLTYIVVFISLYQKWIKFKDYLWNYEKFHDHTEFKSFILS